MGQMSGRVAIVTGGAGAMGSASAVELARQGAKVAIADIVDDAGEDLAAEIRGEGGEATYTHCDVAQVDEVDGLFEKTVKDYGRLDALHTNAFWCRSTELTDLTDEEWSHTLAVTLDAVMTCSRAAVRQMLTSGGGAIVNTSSVNGVVISMPNFAPYCAAKGAVIQLSRSIASDYGQRGIRCNALCPGNVVRRERAPESLSPDNIISWQTCLGRSAYTDEIAKVAAFLLSDAASYITGASVMADCGWTSI